MIKIIVFAFFLLSANHIKAQEQNTPAAKLAHHIADKLKDSLNLTNQQRAKIFSINMQLHKDKMTARSASNDRVIIGKSLQKIENTRDELYKQVLSAEQYLLYVRKKPNLVTAR